MFITKENKIFEGGGGGGGGGRGGVVIYFIRGQGGSM